MADDDVLTPEDEELVAHLVANGTSEVLAREIVTGHTCIPPVVDES